MLTHIAASQNSQYSSRGNGQVIGEASPTPPPSPRFPKQKNVVCELYVYWFRMVAFPEHSQKWIH